jgi:hypothetical protein
MGEDYKKRTQTSRNQLRRLVRETKLDGRENRDEIALAQWLGTRLDDQEQFDLVTMKTLANLEIFKGQTLQEGCESGHMQTRPARPSNAKTYMTQLHESGIGVRIGAVKQPYVRLDVDTASVLEFLEHSRPLLEKARAVLAQVPQELSGTAQRWQTLSYKALASEADCAAAEAATAYLSQHAKPANNRAGAATHPLVGQNPGGIGI